ncbi:MAG: DUF5717 family protein [Lachnospiraceae bacterium]|nr:DUF5717 family protein [Lachnospiraceae bacterium]
MKENLSLFLEIAKSDRQEAKRIFFGDHFKEYYLQDKPRLEKIYTQLMQGKNRNQILEEFLICAGAKSYVRFEIEKEVYTVKKQQSTISIPITQQNWGYEEITIRSDIPLPMDSLITTDQFEQEKYELQVDLKPLSSKTPQCFITLETAYQSMTICIRIENEKKEHDIRQELINLYLDFRCGKITKEEYADRSFDVIAEDEGIEAGLYRFQLAILGGRTEEAQNRMEQLLEEKPWEEGDFVESYYYYLKALYEKNPLITQSSLAIILENENRETKHRQFYLWMRIYMDEKIAFSTKKQLDEIQKLAQKEVLSPILRYEVCAIWNRNPLAIKEINDFTIENMQFGAEHDILSREVWTQYARVLRRMPVFWEAAFALLQKRYQEQKEDEYLQSICKTILRTGHWKKEYHEYFKDALHKSMKINGLMEAYVRTLDQNQFDLLEPSVLHYFAYDHHFSEDEMAYLYTNIHKNQKNYGSITANCLSRASSFVLAAMEHEKISDVYNYLYKQYLPVLIETKSGVSSLPHILFKKKLICHNPNMKSVAVCHFEKREPDIYDLDNGEAFCDIYSDQVMMSFYDSKGDQHIDSVSWELKSIWREADYYEVCKKNNLFHEKILFREAAILEKKDEVTEAELPIIKRLLDFQMLSGEVKEILLELLLNFCYKHQDYQTLEEYLKQVQWDHIRKKNQNAIIEYFISRGLYKEALKGIRRYGFDQLKPELLKKMTHFLLAQLNGRKSVLAVNMCEMLFRQGSEEQEVLTYLQQNIPADFAEPYLLWKRGVETSIYDADFTSYLIVKALEEEQITEELIELFLEYAKREKQISQLFHWALEEIGKWYFANGKSFSDEFFTYLTEFLQEYGWEKLHYPLAWLHAISRQESLAENEKQLAESVMDYFVKQGIYLSFFLRFEGKIRIPQELYCMSFVTYQGRKGCRTWMHCQNGRQGIVWEMPMLEILDGVYIGYFRPFLDEHLEIYITIEGDERKYRKSVAVEPGQMKGKGLKYHKINEMLAVMHSDKVYDMMEQFGETEYLVEQSLKPWF